MQDSLCDTDIFQAPIHITVDQVIIDLFLLPLILNCYNMYEKCSNIKNYFFNVT